MKKIKEFLGNTPLFIGLGFLYVAVGLKKVADKFFDLSFAAHIKLGTDTGKQIEKLSSELKSVIAAAKAAKKAESEDSNKLARVFTTANLNSGGPGFGKKPTTDN